ncbi:MAG: SDR family oxidoreductase [Candidatus Dadabacteria bacterium]
MNRILITGANGFVGYYLVKKLLLQGYSVIATCKGECRLPFKDDFFTYLPMDFTNEEQVKIVFEKYHPGVVVHLGAMSKPDECEQNRRSAFQVNVSGSVNLLEQSRKYKSFFLFLSTDFVFDGLSGMYVEEDEAAPVNFYGETKMLAEQEVKSYGYEWSIVRTVLVYGQTFSGRDNIVTAVERSLKEGKTLKMFDDQVRTPTYVEDLAAGMVSIIEKKAIGIFHICGKDVLTPYGIAIAVANQLGYDLAQVLPIKESDLNEAAKRPKKTGLNISKARRVLGYEPCSFEEGLRKTFKQSD